MTQPEDQPVSGVSIISSARRAFHHQLVEQGMLSISTTKINSGKKNEFTEDVASIADINNRYSRDVARHIAEQLGAPHRPKKLDGQMAGKRFETAVACFLSDTFPHLTTVRPGSWTIEEVGSQRKVDHVAQYHPYRHLDELAQAIMLNQDLKSILGNSYVVSPDVLLVRDAVSDQDINAVHEQDDSVPPVVDDDSALLSPFRLDNAVRRGEAESLGEHTPGFVHAVVSCKWTMRSDRAQNTRSEALNLIRNRKGRAPHIAAITAEPGLSRISSLALGTGDIDVVYHAFLPELTTAVETVGSDDAKEMLYTLVSGDRLRDIADMPIDFAV